MKLLVFLLLLPYLVYSSGLEKAEKEPSNPGGRFASFALRSGRTRHRISPPIIHPSQRPTPSRRTRSVSPEYVHTHSVVYDNIFKILFAEDMERTAHFLNAIYDFKGTDRIVKLHFDRVEEPYSPEGGRAIVIDIKCTTEGGKEFVIEMQKQIHIGLLNRLLFYPAHQMSRQWRTLSAEHAVFSKKTGRPRKFDILTRDQYAKLKPISILTIMNFNFFDSDIPTPGFWDICWRHKPGVIGSDMLSWCFIELPKVRHKVLRKNSSARDRWLQLLTSDEDEQVKLTPAITGGDRIIEAAYCRLDKLSAKELEELELAKSGASIMAGALTSAELKGDRLRQIKVARLMLAKKKPMSEIIEFSELTEGEIIALGTSMT